MRIGDGTGGGTGSRIDTRRPELDLEGLQYVAIEIND